MINEGLFSRTKQPLTMVGSREQLRQPTIVNGCFVLENRPPLSPLPILGGVLEASDDVLY